MIIKSLFTETTFSIPEKLNQQFLDTKKWVIITFFERGVYIL